jgi:hypothetical protein
MELQPIEKRSASNYGDDQKKCNPTFLHLHKRSVRAQQATATNRSKASKPYKGNEACIAISPWGVLTTCNRQSQSMECAAERKA